MRSSAFNPDTSGDGICRTIKAVQYKLGFSDFFRTGSFGATAVIEFYEKCSDRMGA